MERDNDVPLPGAENRMSRFALLLVVLSFACATPRPVTSASTPTPTPSPAPTSSSTGLAYCPPAKFANCTVATCTLEPDGKYICWCFEDDRYSATAWMGSQSSSCVAASGGTLQSRYHPVTAYQECGSGAQVRQWAWCLGISCTLSKNPDPNSNANVRCACLAIPPNVPPVPYVVTTDTYSADNCKFRYWSSATPADVSQITTFLQAQPGLGNLTPPVVLQPPK
jgi:hypothetical protein